MDFKAFNRLRSTLKSLKFQLK